MSGYSTANDGNVDLDDRPPAPGPDYGPRRRRSWRIGDRLALLAFSTRLTLGWPAFALVFLAAGAFAVHVLQGADPDEEVIFRMILSVEVLSFVVLSMSLLPREKESNTLEVLLVSARSRYGLVFLKFLPVSLFVALIAVGLTAGFQWVTSGGFQVWKMLLVPYLLAATAGMFTVALSTHIRNQYAAAVVALVLLIAFGVLVIDPGATFYGFETILPYRGRKPNYFLQRLLVVVAFGFLFNHAARRLSRLELWMR
jgi:hypothetical protein